MFYLVEFFKLCKRNILLSIVLVSSIVGMNSIIHFQNVISKEVSINDKFSATPYFNALITSTVNVEAISRKMKGLPGVVEVVAGKNNIASEIKHLKSQFDSKIISSISSLDHRRLQVKLDHKIHKKNQLLVKEYLARLVGKENITIGSIKRPKKIEFKKDQFISLILDNSVIYGFAIFLIMFAVALVLKLKPLTNQAFIIEKFQRKKNVKMKVLLSGVLVILLLNQLINIIILSELSAYQLIPIGVIIFLILLFTSGPKLVYRG